MNVAASGGSGIWGLSQAISVDKDLMAAVLAARPAVNGSARTMAAAVALCPPGESAVGADGHVDVYA